MSEQQEATTPVTDEGRLQAAIDVMGAETPEESQAEETAPEEEVASEASEAPGTGEEYYEEEPPLTPGEENVAESSKLALLARRERRSREQSKEREEKLSTRESELEERLKSAETLEEKLNNIKRGFANDPVAALKELGIDDGYVDFANALFDEELGDDAPGDYKTQKELRALKARLHRFEEEQKTSETRKQQDAEKTKTEHLQRNYINEMEGFMESSTKEEQWMENYEFAGNLFKSNPQEAVQAMYGIAYGYAEQNPQEKLPPPEELAEALNHNLKTLLSPVVDAILAARGHEDETPADKQPKRQTKTLRNSQTRRTATRAPAEDADERFQRALQALEAE